MKKSIFYSISVIVLIAVLGFIIFNNFNKQKTSDSPINPVVYDTTLKTKYITTPDTIWPPEKTITTDVFSCNENGDEIKLYGKTVLKEINKSNYCITTSSEGAAGSTYTTYKYKKEGMETTFILRFVQCDNYDDPQKTECKLERSNFDPDILGVGILNN